MPIATGEIVARMAPFAVDRKRRGQLIEEGAISSAIERRSTETPSPSTTVKDP